MDEKEDRQNYSHVRGSQTRGSMRSDNQAILPSTFSQVAGYNPASTFGASFKDQQLNHVNLIIPNSSLQSER